ncbi:MAG: BspA family leucine-rich repeat surface protein [Mogibacterium sp.]|nr:BspA family leucine-rich repeat surface protein [Mogibacterium sp.]
MKNGRLFAILLALIMIVSAVPAASYAADPDIASGTCGTCRWTIDSEGVLTIGAGSMTDWVEMPPWYDYSNDIKAVKTSGSVKLATAFNMFAECYNLKSIDLRGFDTSNVTNMSGMFAYCTEISEPVDFSNFNTSSVTDMSRMFLISNVPDYATGFSSFDTSRVEDMSWMFYVCKTTKKLDLSSFNTSNVKDMSNMFCQCSDLTDLDISNFNTGSVLYMPYMFSGCGSLNNLDLSSFDTGKCAVMDCMFDYCFSLESLKVGNWSYASFNSAYTKYPEFPIDMTDSESGTAYSAGDNIPELSYRTYESAKEIDISNADVVLSKSSYVYSGKPNRPSVTVTYNGQNLAEGTDYTVNYSRNVAAGTAYAEIVGQSGYSGSVTKTFTITRAANPLSVKAKTATVKYSAVKKKNKSLAVTKVLSFTKAGQGAMTYTKSSGNKKITINKTTGKVTIKKGLKKGKYKVKVKVKAAGNSNYQASSVKTITFIIKVK